MSSNTRNSPPKSKSSGFIKLSRDIYDCGFWPKRRRYTELEALLDLKLSAHYKPDKICVGGRTIHLPADSVFTSQVRLAKRWKWNRRTVSRFLAQLLVRQLCRIETRRGIEHGFTIITFLKFSNFAEDDDGSSPADNLGESHIEIPIECTYSKTVEEVKTPRRKNRIPEYTAKLYRGDQSKIECLDDWRISAQRVYRSTTR